MSDSEDYMMEGESIGGDDDDFRSESSGDEENEQIREKPRGMRKTAPKATTKGKPSSKVSAKVLSETKANVMNVAGNGKNAKTVEETYQKKTQLEHILLRPDTYSEYYY